jgi:hypothetical protein
MHICTAGSYRVSGVSLFLFMHTVSSLLKGSFHPYPYTYAPSQASPLAYVVVQDGYTVMLLFSELIDRWSTATIHCSAVRAAKTAVNQQLWVTR